jgi:hypothetical protein
LTATKNAVQMEHVFSSSFIFFSIIWVQKYTLICNHQQNKQEKRGQGGKNAAKRRHFEL